MTPAYKHSIAPIMVTHMHHHLAAEIITTFPFLTLPNTRYITRITKFPYFSCPSTHYFSKKQLQQKIFQTNNACKHAYYWINFFDENKHHHCWQTYYVQNEADQWSVLNLEMTAVLFIR